MVVTLVTLAVQPASVIGVVRDSTGMAPIAFAEVAVSTVGGEARVAKGVSDRFGAFVVPGVPEGPVLIAASAFGYAPWARYYDELPAGPVEILLAPSPISLDSLGVVVSGRKRDPMAISRDAFVVDPVMIRTMPAVLESDVLRVMAMSPSASAVSDFVAVPYVRGGTAEGTPILLDGVRLFNPFHLGGFFSAVNVGAVDHATLLPSSGPGAQHVGSLSGAIEIATRDGARDQHRVAGAVGLASSRLSVEGPLGGNGSFLIDGRRTYIDLLTRGLKWVGAIQSHFPYSFSDLHGKVTGDFGSFKRLSMTAYLSSEGFSPADSTGTSRSELDWGNTAVVVHYRDRLKNGAFLDVKVGRSRFGNDLLGVRGLDRPVVDTLTSGGGRMTEDRADIVATWHLTRGTVSAGGQAIRFAGDHNYTHSDFERLLIPLTLRSRQWRIGAFMSVDGSLGGPWEARAGMRVDRFPGVGNALSPSTELSYTGRWWEARISVARSNQMLVSLRNEESMGASVLAYDLMVPVERGPLPRNTEFSVGWEGSRGPWRLRLDAYARRMNNLLLPALPADLWDEPVLGDPALRMLGSGTARGVEASYSWIRGPLFTMGSYRWSRVTRTVGADTYTPRFHRDHELELGAAVESGRSMWSARFSLRSGQPATPILATVPVGIHEPPGNETTGWKVLFGEYNAGRLPPYRRLDLGWRRRSRESRVGERFITPFVSVINLFIVPNVLAAELRPDDSYDSGVKVERLYTPQMPILVFFGVEFGF